MGWGREITGIKLATSRLKNVYNNLIIYLHKFNEDRFEDILEETEEDVSRTEQTLLALISRGIDVNDVHETINMLNEIIEDYKNSITKQVIAKIILENQNDPKQGAYFNLN